MPRIQFTKRDIEMLSYDPATGAVDYFDTRTKGLGQGRQGFQDLLRQGGRARPFETERIPDGAQDPREVRRDHPRTGMEGVHGIRRQGGGLRARHQAVDQTGQDQGKRFRRDPGADAGGLLPGEADRRGDGLQVFNGRDTPASSAAISRPGSRSPWHRRPN